MSPEDYYLLLDIVTPLFKKEDTHFDKSDITIQTACAYTSLPSTRLVAQI